VTAPILPLRAAILARCRPDPELAALMGGTVALYDEPPRGASPVYALFGPVEARDASCDGSPGHEQEVEIHVWARPGSTRTALDCAARIGDLLHDATDLAVAGHRLVNLRVVRLDTRRDQESGLGVATLRLRAVTEVA
jgi:hypothetical protein